MQQLQRVLVALARTESDCHLLRHARRLSGLWPEAAFTFVHVLAWPRSGQDPATVVHHERARRQLEDAIAFEFGAGARLRVLSGPRVDRLLESAAEDACDLLLLGHRRGRRGRRSLVRRLAMQAPCSVLMVPEDSGDTLRAVAAAIDFSEHSAMAVAAATLLAGRIGSPECLVFHALAESAPPPVPGQFERFLAPLDLNGVPVHTVTQPAASVSDAITRLAAFYPIDLVVMGVRGDSESESVLLGNEAEQMLIESTRPVLVTKRRGERLALLQTLLDRDFLRMAPPVA